MDLISYQYKTLKKEPYFCEFDLGKIRIRFFKVELEWYPEIEDQDSQVLKKKLNEFLNDHETKGYLEFMKWIQETYCGEEVEYGFIDTDDEDIDEKPVSAHIPFIKIPNEFDSNRSLTIYTWGKAFRDRKPNGSEANFNASVLHGRKAGINLKKYNGTNEIVQKSVATSSNFISFMENILKKVENENLKAISVNCRKGRHRSVTVAEILKKYFYPKSSVYHIELKKTA